MDEGGVFKGGKLLKQDYPPELVLASFYSSKQCMVNNNVKEVENHQHHITNREADIMPAGGTENLLVIGI